MQNEKSLPDIVRQRLFVCRLKATALPSSSEGVAVPAAALAVGGGLLGLLKGIAILMVARWALCDLLQWVPADVAAESYVLPWLTPSAFFSLFGK